MSEAQRTMIDVERLTKHYPSSHAVDRLSFHVGRGEIVGLLGPNGAGKTTTMRMLTTFLAPTSGRAVLGGHDVLDEPLEVRKKVGYLPENVPLYPEMRVREYLGFRARLKDVPRTARRSSIDRVLAGCRLQDVEGRVIGHLSKGYRQRVGLADAMVHDPDILVLDEPTAGLDPIQIREVRSLVRELGERHTILLSTHIMSEVEAVCGRVIMMVQGRIVVDDKLDQVQAKASIVVEVRGPVDPIKKAIETVPGARKVTLIDETEEVARFEVQTSGEDIREALAQRLVGHGWGLRRLDLRRSTLEDRFVAAVREAAMIPDPGPGSGSGPETEAA